MVFDARVPVGLRNDDAPSSREQLAPSIAIEYRNDDVWGSMEVGHR